MKTRNTDAAWMLIGMMFLTLCLFFASEAYGKPMPKWHPCQFVDDRGACFCKSSGKIIYIVEWTTRARQLAHYLQGCARHPKKFEHYHAQALNLLQMDGKATIWREK